jgi:non-specific serine/threonine protein kinase
MLGRNALYLQDYPRSEALGRERLTLCRALRDDWAECSTLCTMGHLAWFLGDRRRATALLEESLALARACGHTHVVALALYRLGHVALVRGDVGPAAERFRQGLRVCRELGEVPAGRQSLAWTLEGIAGVAHAHGSPAQAARLLGAAAALHQATGESLPRTERADGERTTAAVRGAMDGQRFAAAWAAGGAMPAEQAVADAQALLERAIAGAAAAPNARPSPRSQADGGVTPREREVAALVAAGLTNRQIGAELVITERTVISHIEHIMAKLSLRSRAQIAAWAAERGLHRAAPR